MSIPGYPPSGGGGNTLATYIVYDGTNASDLTNKFVLTAGNGVTFTPGTGTLTISASVSGASGTGTVTTVGDFSPLFTVTNRTTTPAFTAVNQNAGLIYGGPVTGSAATPLFRNLASGDFGANLLDYSHGGTGLSSTPTNGQLNIGNGAGFTRAALTQGTNVTITNGVGSITISAAGSGNVGTVSVGNLSPLFTSSVANPTTAPAVSFTLSNAPSGMGLFGPTSGTGVSTYRNVASGDFGANLLDVTHGGTGSSVIPTDGQIPIGSTSGQTYVPATITQGTGITIVNGPGTITISSTASGGGGGGISYTWSTLSGSATATANTKYSVDCSGGSFTHYFPSGTPADGSLIGYKLKAVGSNPSQTFTIQPYTTIDGSSAALTSNRVNDYFQFEYSAAFGGWLQTS